MRLDLIPKMAAALFVGMLISGMAQAADHTGAIAGRLPPGFGRSGREAITKRGARRSEAKGRQRRHRLRWHPQDHEARDFGKPFRHPDLRRRGQLNQRCDRADLRMSRHEKPLAQ